MIKTMTGQSFKLESLPFARPEGVVIDFNRSQAFSFRGFGMGKFKRMSPPLCACGCGEKVTRSKIKPYDWNNFIHTHHNKKGKTHFNYGRKNHDYPKGKKHYLYGKKRPKHSKAMTGEKNPNFGKTGINHPNYGKSRPEISKQMSGKGNPMFGKKRPEISKRMLNGQAAYMCSCNQAPSKPQVKLYKLAKSLYPNAILNHPSLNFCIDIVIPDRMIAIEYDGSYWHQDKKADEKRQGELEAIGWRFLRYCDHVPSAEELKNDLAKDN